MQRLKKRNRSEESSVPMVRFLLTASYMVAEWHTIVCFDNVTSRSLLLIKMMKQLYVFIRAFRFLESQDVLQWVVSLQQWHRLLMLKADIAA